MNTCLKEGHTPQKPNALTHHMNMMSDRVIMCQSHPTVTEISPTHTHTHTHTLRKQHFWCLSLSFSRRRQNSQPYHIWIRALSTTLHKSALAATHTYSTSHPPDLRLKTRQKYSTCHGCRAAKQTALRCLQLATSNQKSTYICVYMKSD